VRSATIVGVGLLALAACRTEPEVDVAVEALAIRASAARQNDWFVARDTMSIGGLYTSDAVLMPAGRPRVYGPDSIRHTFAVSAEWNTGLRVTPVAILVARSGELAVEEGTWEWRGRTPQGETRDVGKHIVVWVKRDGTWRISRDIFNSDGAADPSQEPQR